MEHITQQPLLRDNNPARLSYCQGPKIHLMTKSNVQIGCDLTWKIGSQDSSPSDGYQGDVPY